MYVILITRCIFFYFLLIFALRFMGKREVGELSVFDIVIYLVMSELLALAVSETNQSIWKAIVPIVTLAILQFCISYMLLKSTKMRDIIDGNPVILIHNGVLMQEQMRKERYNIDDLLAQLRGKDIACLSDVQFAVLENNGTLSLFSKNNCNVLHPYPIIQDGVVNERVLIDLKKEYTWLLQQLHRAGYESEKQVFLSMVMKEHLYILPKNQKK